MFNFDKLFQVTEIYVYILVTLTVRRRRHMKNFLRMRIQNDILPIIKLKIFNQRILYIINIYICIKTRYITLVSISLFIVTRKVY